MARTAGQAGPSSKRQPQRPPPHVLSLLPGAAISCTFLPLHMSQRHLALALGI